MADPVTGRSAAVRVVRASLTLLALAALAAPFVLSWRLHEHLRSVAKQETTSPGPLPANVVAGWRGLAAGLPDRAAPVVLTYHDIRPGGGGPYTVTPQQFESHMSALRAAGYETLSAAEVAAYAQGGSVPRRSVVITFDDGARGLWIYGDAILARHGMRASAFLITGLVGRRPYYLSWEEISRMAASGRWDFQSHTHDLHARVAIGPDGRTGSLLTNRVYYAAAGEWESLARYQARIRADFAAAFRAFEQHGLPRPVLFSYPFSDSGEGRPSEHPSTGTTQFSVRSGAGPTVAKISTETLTPAAERHASAFTHHVIKDSFALAMSNHASRPMPPSRRSSAAQEYERLEVRADTTADVLMREVMRRTEIPPLGMPLEDHERWTSVSGKPVGQGDFPLTGRRPPPGRDTYRYAAYAPYGSADWDHYAVEVRVSRLAANTNTASLYARIGGRAPVAIRLSTHTAQLIRGRSGGRVLAEHPLTPGATHHVMLTVQRSRIVALVDGAIRLSTPTRHGADNTGGIALSIVRDRTGQRWPVFTGLRVTPSGNLPTSAEAGRSARAEEPGNPGR
ncbi:polysaccharide deacetylase family protein [Nonomuraea sp. B10E15]|uniref:polysaccharide deacetylase family protein n=1 Tax=Nonomuraea sp. B10E15 TaxID=3153560 RepID=UPI00325C3E69